MTIPTILTACLLCAAAAAEVPRNLADNPSAEYDRNRDGLPDGWTPMAFASPAQVTWDRRGGRTGGACLAIADSRNPGGTGWKQTVGRWITGADRAVAAGQTYTLEAWIRTAGVTGRASACIAWFGDRKWLAESYTQRVGGTGDWRKARVTATAPAGATRARIYLNLSNSAGTARFDDIALVAGERPPGPFTTVDIAAACTGRLPGAAPRPGEAVFRGIPCAVPDPAGNGGRGCVVVGGGGKPAASVTVGRTCETLYFLHACRGAKKGRPAGGYELVYVDGETRPVSLTAGREVCGLGDPRETAGCVVGWEGGGGEEAVGLGLFPVVNPRPRQEIASVRIVAAGRGPALIVAAITAGAGPPAVTAPPVRYAFTDTAGWYPFSFPLDDVNRDAIDLTGYLDPPAGRHGFVSVSDDGHFHFENGKRVRFFGTNIGGGRAFPDTEDAGIVARRLAKYGVNLLRIHAIDSRWAGLIDYSRGDSRHLDPAKLDRLDYFFARLKERGIYVYFDCLDYRRFLPGDGVTDAADLEHGWHHSIKGASVFNDRMIALQKEFATAFYTHRNPYTKLRYCDDPAVAVVEITNENSVFYFRNTTLTLPVYVDELKSRWNRRLLQRYGTRGKLAAAWTDGATCALLDGEDPAAGTVFLPMQHLYQDPAGVPFAGKRSPVRVDAMVRFFFDLERRYYAQMRGHLRTIGVRVPITGTNQSFCPAGVCAESVNDFMSRNNYWCHPNVHAKPFFTFRDRTVLRSDLARRSNPVTNVASSTVSGKPMIVPEFNWPWPIRYRAECLPMMAAYACLQDWDGLLFFAYNPGRKTLECFGSQSDPVRWGTFPAAAVLFHRGDVATAKNTVHVNWPEREIFRGRPSHIRAKTSPFRHFTYRSKVRNVFSAKGQGGDAKLVDGATFAPPAQNRYRSDTGELDLDTGRKLFTINTPRTRAAVGFLAEAGEIDLGGLRVACRTPYAAVIATALDGLPIGRSRRVLLTAVARAENTGQAFNPKHNAVPERGREPVLVKPVDAVVTIPVPGPVAARALDETGRPKNKLPGRFADGVFRLALKTARSPWCVLAAE